MNKKEWTKEPSHHITREYFNIIRIHDYYYEIQSKNTKHCWVIYKHSFDQIDRPIIIYHKHSSKQRYYHKHGEVYSIKHAIVLIMRHDEYVIKYAYH